jgi:hypothetical protein
MNGAQGMLKAGMGGTRINKTGEAQLFDPSQALQVRMLEQIEDEISGDDDEPMNRIIDNFAFVDDGGHEA